MESGVYLWILPVKSDEERQYLPLDHIGGMTNLNCSQNDEVEKSLYILGGPFLSPAPKDDCHIYKESVELTFVHLLEGWGKTLSEINDTIPHTRIDMGYRGT